MENSIKKIAIVGRDADAWITALMLQLTLGRSNNPVVIELIELPSNLHPQDYYTVMPSHQILHRLLGVNENALMKTCAGVACMAQRFSNWSGANAPFVHAYDTHGAPLGNVDFVQYWVSARKKGLAVPLEDFSLGAVAAKQGRLISFGDDMQTFSRAANGYHFNAIPYLQAVGAAALRAGLKHRTGAIKLVAEKQGQIESIQLQDGTLVEADLFIDATGAEAQLISQLDNNHIESWRHWLPCDRIMVASAAKLEPVPAFSQISAFSSGWMGFFPLVNRTAVTAVYSSVQDKSDSVFEKIAHLSGMKIGDSVESTFTAGARQKPWVGNCIALGSAAVTLDALDATDLHILHVGLSLLREFFPVDKCDMKESTLFNNKMYAYAENVRDFQIAHYHLNKRVGEPLWDAVREMKIPDTLQNKINLFKSCGRIAMREYETFQEENWTSLFIGHGLMPDSYDPLVDRMSEQEQMAQFQKMLHYIAAEIKNMPSLQAHVEMY